ncbi:MULTISPECIES: TAXI family TRAP transporter solute-binding subunit [Thalassospira]|uniref:C4-dicarboxylate ABC transporter substrate-binding protein n=2 Tax=Thalassospira TaxID=168934 RepID=A0A367W0B7_9PROT|nr:MULTISPECIES: TAXI family TRAP transporter solute-binding subunit [Thalassospira]MDG4717921.1 TAXI family TRAP transporter solute-binding subunit [Thalassospira sp. FZY0004]RCK32427.1 hypothetical protein TH19_19285 [Thalassospira profundimaris]
MKLKSKLFAAILGLSVVGAASAQAETRDYLISTAGTGGSFYPVGVGIATLVKLKLGTRPENQINLSAITSQGSFDNVNILSEERADFAVVQSLMTDFGYFGTGDFEGNPKKNLRAITALMFNTKQFIALNELAPTGTMDDLKAYKGKKVVLGARNSGGLLSFQMFMRKIGIDDPEHFVDQSYMGFRQRAEALINGNLDGINLTSGVPNSSATLAMASMEGKVKMLSFTPEMRAKVTDGTVWGPYTIPANTYPGQPEPIETVAQPNLLITGAHVPDDVVYEITKTMFENLPFLKSVHGSLNDMDIETALKGITVPLHPGAVKYYQEVGIDIPAKLIAQ